MLNNHLLPHASQSFSHIHPSIRRHIKIKLSLCLINQALWHEDIRGSGGITPPFLTSALVVSFTPQALCRRGNCHRYPLGRRLGGPQSRSGSYGVKKNFFSLPGIEPRPSSPSLYRLSYPGSLRRYIINAIEKASFNKVGRCNSIAGLRKHDLATWLPWL
jgi:hypothetical protein